MIANIHTEHVLVPFLRLDNHGRDILAEHIVDHRMSDEEILGEVESFMPGYKAD